MNSPQADQKKIDKPPSGVIDLNERNWLPRHCRGEAGAFEELVNAYRTLVFTFLFRYGIAQQHRDDLFQEIFLKVHQSAHRYRASEPLRPWLISIVLNSVRNFRRDHGRRKHFMKQLTAVSQAANPESQSLPHQTAADDVTEQQSTVQWLEQRIGTLPERQREILILSTIKGLRMHEIAHLLAMPESTVKTHLRRARLSLAESLARREQPTMPAHGSST
ncbi:MAG TPA: RNA polymerase sigma factor [Xanthomonadales bacterium]|nr:RNA polymerase sigma factor [Xanthomonadales bacterium]